MQTRIVRIKDHPAIGPNDLGTGLNLTHEMPKNFAYVSLIIREIINVTAGVAAPTRTEDGQHRAFSRFQLKRDGGTPIDVTARNFGLFVEYLHGVADDVQETTPLAVGANQMEHYFEVPFCDPTVPFASPQWVETLLVGWRRKNLESRISVPAQVDDIYTAGGGGTIALVSLLYSIYARVILNPTKDEVKDFAGLDKEMRYQSQQEASAAGAARAYGVYRDTNLDRDVRILKLSQLLTDAAVRTPDMLEESTVKIGADFVLPENFDADGLKAINVWTQDYDAPDGLYIANLDTNKDHVTAPFASEGAAAELWRTTAAPVGAGVLDTVQMSVGAAEYNDEK